MDIILSNSNGGTAQGYELWVFLILLIVSISVIALFRKRR